MSIIKFIYEYLRKWTAVLETNKNKYIFKIMELIYLRKLLVTFNVFNLKKIILNISIF